MKSLLILLVSALTITAKAQTAYKTPLLEIEPVAENVYIHRSFLQTESWGNVPCNGMVYISKGEAIIFDTPTNDSASQELIEWIESTGKAKVTAVVVNHFHNDCLGGLSVFHSHGIPSYASNRTQQLAQKKSVKAIPQYGFNNKLILLAGGDTVINQYFGEAHTSDNIVSYIPSKETLFGGCMVKSTGASKGNLEDANTKEWSNTVRRIKNTYPYVKIVVTGHGQHGDKSLPDYTINLFEDTE